MSHLALFDWEKLLKYPLDPFYIYRPDWYVVIAGKKRETGIHGRSPIRKRKSRFGSELFLMSQRMNAVSLKLMNDCIFKCTVHYGLERKVRDRLEMDMCIYAMPCSIPVGLHKRTVWNWIVISKSKLVSYKQLYTIWSQGITKSLPLKTHSLLPLIWYNSSNFLRWLFCSFNQLHSKHSDQIFIIRCLDL